MERKQESKKWDISCPLVLHLSRWEVLICLKQIRANGGFVLMIAGAFTGKAQASHVLKEISSRVGRLLGKNFGYLIVHQLEAFFVDNRYFPSQEMKNVLALRCFEELRRGQTCKVCLRYPTLQFAYEFTCIHKQVPFYTNVVNLECRAIANTSISL